MQLVSAESAIRNTLAAQFPEIRVVTELPSTLDVNTIRVTELPGSDGPFLSMANTILDVEFFSPDGRDAARTGLASVHDFMRFTLPGSTVTDSGSISAFVLSVKTSSSPHWEPYDNTNVRRFTATYQISLHTQE